MEQRGRADSLGVERIKNVSELPLSLVNPAHISVKRSGKMGTYQANAIDPMALPKKTFLMHETPTGILGAPEYRILSMFRAAFIRETGEEFSMLTSSPLLEGWDSLGRG